MKILVFSDSHGVLRHMQAALDAERPDRVLHLGDVLWDARALAANNPDVPVDYVCGNCDGFGAQPEERELDLCGYRIFMTHGHLYHVKSSSVLAERAALERGADVLLFGHTHVPVVDRQGPLWVMNPGTIRGWGRITYGVITIENNILTCKTVQM